VILLNVLIYIRLFPTTILSTLKQGRNRWARKQKRDEYKQVSPEKQETDAANKLCSCKNRNKESRHILEEEGTIKMPCPLLINAGQRATS
jgi:beta-lactamase regulating signal transducer with metallopeptidase domain